MSLFLLYLIKLSIAITIVCLFYFIALRRLTFYNYNRVYLFGYSILCFLLPIIDIAPVIETAKDDAASFLSTMPSITVQQFEIGQPLVSVHQQVNNSFQIWPIITGIIICGSVLLTIRLFIQFFSIYKLKKNASVIKEEAFKIYYVNKDIVPFSFAKGIFLSSKEYQQYELQEIIFHESIHVKHKHTIDLIWGEVLCIFNWYNPFAWALRYAIKQNLEFIADKLVLQNGINKKSYQYHLLHVTGVSANKIANHFNISSLKNRIIMMNKLQSAKINLLRFLFLLPLAIVLLTAFRNKMESITQTKLFGRLPIIEQSKNNVAIANPNTNDFLKQTNGTKEMLQTNELNTLNNSEKEFSFTIFGIVINEVTRKPIANINIIEGEKGITTTTNEKGIYKLVINSNEERIRYNIKMDKAGLPFISGQSGNLFTSHTRPATGILMLTTIRVKNEGAAKPGLVHNLTNFESSLKFTETELQTFLANHLQNQANLDAINVDVALMDSILVIKDNKSYLYSYDGKVRGIVAETNPIILIDGKTLTAAQLNAQYKLKDFKIISLRVADPTIDKETGKKIMNGSFEIVIDKGSPNL